MIVEENILNGQQLINLRSKENRDLPVIGQKEYTPTNSWLEKKQIQSALAERKALLEEQRVEKSNALSSAEWIPEVKKAKVTKRIGKSWENYGHHADDADWLFPEEALLLLETNSLELFLNEIPLSIERGYVTLLHEDTGCTLNEYRVYSHLARLGYRLFRHLEEVSVTRYEKEINLDQHVLRQKKSYNSSAKANSSNIGNIESDVFDKSNDLVNVDSVVLAVTSDDTIEPITEKQIDGEVSLGQDKVQGTINEVINIEPDGSVNSSDVSLVTSKAPVNSSHIVSAREDICIIDDDDDVVEIPISKEIVVVNDISSSDDEAEDVPGSDDESSSDSEDNDDASSIVSQRSNSNWKRQSNECDNIIDVSESPLPLAYAVRTNYVTINEFLYEPLLPDASKSNENDVDVIELSDDESTPKINTTLGQEIERFYKEIEVIDVDSEPEEINCGVNKCTNLSKLSKRAILDLFPTLKNGVVNIVTVPPLELLPPNIKPSCKEYKLSFHTSDSVDVFNNNRSNRNNVSNNNNASRYFSRNTSGVGNRQHEFQRMYNRSSFYYNQNRTRCSDYTNNPFWGGTPPQWHVNTIQNQVSQIREMATGMMQVASSLLTLPFVQQTLSNIPNLFGSFQQPSNRMPVLYDSNQQYHQNQLFYGSRFNNYNNNQNFSGNSSLLNQPNNMLVYNPPIRQQYNAPNNYSNNYNFDSNFQRQNYLNPNNDNYVQTFSEQNVQHSSHQSFSSNYNNRENSCNNILPQQRMPQQPIQNMNRSRRSYESYSRNSGAKRNHIERTNDNFSEDNVNTASQSKEILVNQKGDRDSSFANNSQDGSSTNDNRSNSRKRRRAMRGQLDYPDCSVFSDDIAVTEAALAVDSTIHNHDFIPLSESRTDGNTDDCIRKDHINKNRHFDVNGTDYGMGDEFNYVDFNKRYDNRNRGYYRGSRPWYNRNRRPNWRSNQGSPNKRLRFDNETRNTSNMPRNNPRKSRSMPYEPVNVCDDSRNELYQPRDELNQPRDDLNEMRSTASNDNIEIIEDFVGCETARNIIINHKRQKRNRQRKYWNENNIRDSVKFQQKKRICMDSNLKNNSGSIEVIDIDLDEPLSFVKTEGNTYRQANIKSEKNNDSLVINKETDTRCSTTLIKQEGLEDETSVNSVLSNSCVSTNSTNSSCIIKSEPGSSVVKKESIEVKRETESIAITTSITSVTTSGTGATVMTTTTSTVVSLKLEENVSVKSEKSPESNKDSCVTVPESAMRQPASIKTEKSCEVDQSLVKQESDVRQIPSRDIIHSEFTVKTEIRSSNKEVSNTRKSNEDVSVIENIVNTSEVTVPTGGRQFDEEIPVSSHSAENVEVTQNETPASNSEKEVGSWAQLKQKSSAIIAPLVETVTPPEIIDEDEESEEEEDEREDDQDQIRPIVTAEDCKSIGTLLSALQIIGTANLSHSAKRKLKISFDVYIPSVPLKKSSRGLPNYRLVTVSFRDEKPSPGEMAELSSRFEDGVPILVAVVSPDSISFFSMSAVRLPTDDGS